MSRIDDGFRSLSQVTAPELWSAIQSREPRPSEPTPSPFRRIAIITFALLVSVSSVVLLARALREPNTNVPVGTGSPTVLVPPEFIVFTRAASDSLDAVATLEAVSPEGGKPTPVSIPGIDATFVGQPAWSPDGSRLAIVVGPAGHVSRYAGDGDIVVMNANGTDQHRLTSGAGASHPSWSPDGRQLVFVRDQGQQLVTVNDDGSADRVISKERGYYQWPSWSPDGRWIAFQSAPSNDPEQTAVFLIHPNGTGLKQITPGAASEGSPAWSPRGDEIAYRVGDAIWVMASDGSNQHAVTHPCRLPCVGNSDTAPSWSPDGSQLVFERQEGGSAVTRVYIVNVATGHVRLLVPTEPHAGSPSWRP